MDNLEDYKIPETPDTDEEYTTEELGQQLTKKKGTTMTTAVATFEQFQQQMIAHAKAVQGENYAGDDYYIQECWREHFEDGVSAEDAVNEDMTYWD